VTYVAVTAVVFAVNLLPALGPPTWAVLVLFRLHRHLDPVALVVLGAVAAASGRLVLAHVAARFAGRLSPERQARLASARERLLRHRAGAVAGLGLFALSPVPSGQLFVAAGIVRVPVLPLTLAFFAGRVVSYSLYVTAASLAQANLGDVVLDSVRSPWAIGLQLLFLVAVAALPLLHWRGAPRATT
jgi:membrane protein YqaA with SNARE-associated domain